MARGWMITRMTGWTGGRRDGRAHGQVGGKAQANVPGKMLSRQQKHKKRGEDINP